MQNTETFTAAYEAELGTLRNWAVTNVAIGEFDRNRFSIVGTYDLARMLWVSNDETGLAADPADATEWTVQVLRFGDVIESATAATLVAALGELEALGY